MLLHWTIYKNPSDYPHLYVARVWDTLTCMPVENISIILSASLKPLQNLMLDKQLHRIPRDVGDDPVIVESWI